jgi:hypothetical protein
MRLALVALLVALLVDADVLQEEAVSERSREQVIARRPSGRSKRHLRCREEPPPRKQTQGSSKIGS